MYLWLTALTSKRWMRWEKTKNDHVDAAQGRFAEVIGQVKVVKSFVSNCANCACSSSTSPRRCQSPRSSPAGGT